MNYVFIKVAIVIMIIFGPSFCFAGYTESQLVSFQTITQEIQLLRAEVVSSHIDSLAIMLENVQSKIEELSPSLSLIENRINEVTKLISQPCDPGALEGYKKELNDLPEDKEICEKQLEKLHQIEEKIRATITLEINKLSSLQKKIGGGDDIQLINTMFTGDE